MKGLPSIRPAKLSRKVLLQAAMKDRGVSQADIARETGLSEATVSRVIAGTHRHPAVEQLVATKLELDPADLFPPREAAVA